MKRNSVSLNWLLTMSNKILVFLVPLITTPYISKALGAEMLGVYTYCLSYSSFFIVIGKLGIPLYGKRAIAVYREDENKKNQVFSELLIIQSILMIISYFMYFFVMKYVGIYEKMFFVCGLGHMAAIVDIGWFFEGEEEYKIVVIRNIFVKMLSVFLIFIFVKTPEDAFIYAGCLFGSSVIGNITSWKSLFSYVKLVKVNNKSMLKHIKPAFLLMIPYAVTQLFEIIDKGMLGMISSNMTEVAYYEQSRKIISLSMTLITSLGIVIMPRLALYFQQNRQKTLKEYINKSLDVTLLLSIAIAWGCVAVSGNLVPWFFGDEFYKVEDLLILCAPLFVFIGISDLVGVQVLTAIHKERFLLRINVASVILNIVFNAIFIPFMDSIGAMLATVIAEFVKCICLVLYCRNLIEVKFMIKRSFMYNLYGIGMFLILNYLSKTILINANIVNTFLLMVIGIFVYGICLVVTKNSWIKWGYHKIQRFIK